MRKLLKTVLIILTLLIGAVLVLSLALKLFFPTDKLRRIVEEQIRVHLNREAQLGGATLGLTRITLDRFKLSEVSSFSKGTFLEVDKMTVQWELLPLLSRKAVIKAIILNKPQIQIIKRRDGKTYNISDLASASASAKAPADKSASTSAKASADKSVPSALPKEGGPARRSLGEGGWSWRVDEIDLLKGVIRFEDQSPAQQTSVLSGIDLVIRDFDPTRVQGHLEVGQVKNPVYTAQDFSMTWSLRDIDPTLGHLQGNLHIEQGPGLIQNLTRLADSSPGARLALLPFIALQNLTRLGVVSVRGFPDLSHLTIDHIKGNYDFKNGSMTISTFQLAGPQLTLDAVGTIQLVSEALSIDAHFTTPPAQGNLDLKTHISGTLSKPVTDLKQKFFKATVKQILNQPGVQKDINDALKNIFH